MVQVLHYDAFSPVIHQGNPAGVVLDCEGLTEDTMQEIAKQVGFNETVFVLRSGIADVRLKYFTPGHEINLCGHATVGALYALKSRGLIGSKEQIAIETNVGVLPISFGSRDGQLFVTMKQDQPRFIPYKGDVQALAESIGLEREDIDTSLPIVYGNTGTWTLLVPIRDLRKFADMRPDNRKFPELLHDCPRASVHPFCLNAYDPAAMMHARHFSSPYSGTVEDAVTGTASGVMGAYYLTYLNGQAPSIEFAVEQGQEVGKDGRVMVRAVRDGRDMEVYISGTAVFVREFEVR